MPTHAEVSKVIARFGQHREKYVPAVALGVDRFYEQVIGDAQQIAPIKTGTMAGSGTPGATAADVAAMVPVQITPEKIHKEGGFNTDYAAAVHERLDLHHDQGQAKFFEASLRNNAPKAAPYIAADAAKTMGG